MLHYKSAACALLAALLGSAFAAADAAGVKAVLAHTPASAQAGLVIPSAEALDTEIAGVFTPEGIAAAKANQVDVGEFFAKLGAELKVEGAKNFKDIAAGIGLDPVKPLGVFINGSGGGVSYAAILPVADEAKAKAALKLLARNGDFKETDIGGTKAQYNDVENVAYAIDGGLMLVATKDLFAEAKAGKGDLGYGAANSPTKPGEEIALMLRLDDLVKSPVMVLSDAEKVKPTVEYFNSYLNEVFVTLSVGQKPGYLRISGKEKPEAPKPAAPAPGAAPAPKMTPAAAEAEAAKAAAKPATPAAPVGDPGSLMMHKILGGDGVAVLNLRYTPSIIDFAIAVATAFVPDPKKIQGSAALAKPMVSGQLRDEAAAAVYGLNDKKQPRVLLAIGVKDPKSTMGFLNLAKIPAAPRMTYKEIPVLGGPDIRGMDIYIAGMKKVVVASNDEALIRSAIDRLSEEKPFMVDSQLPKDAVEAGNYGLLVIDQKKLSDAAASALPLLADVKIGDGNVQFTLEGHKGYRSATLSTASDIGALISGLAPGFMRAAEKPMDADKAEKAAEKTEKAPAAAPKKP